MNFPMTSLQTTAAFRAGQWMIQQLLDPRAMLIAIKVVFKNHALTRRGNHNIIVAAAAFEIADDAVPTDAAEAARQIAAMRAAIFG